MKNGLFYEFFQNFSKIKNITITDLNNPNKKLIIVGYDDLNNLIIQHMTKNSIIFKSHDFQIFVKQESFFYYVDSIKPEFLDNIFRNLTTRITLKIDTSSVFDTSFENDLFITLNYRECKRGEYFDLTLLFCVECQPDTYLFTKDYICRSCKNEPHLYCYGGFNISPKFKHWRKDENSVKFLRCTYEGICYNTFHFNYFIFKIFF
jgi:hypothetical protein